MSKRGADVPLEQVAPAADRVGGVEAIEAENDGAPAEATDSMEILNDDISP